MFTDSSTTQVQAPSRVGRLLYGGILAYMAVDGFIHNEKRVEIAREKEVPVPEFLVPFTTGMLLIANLGIVFWKYPRASAGAIIVFFLGTTPKIHDFWTMEGKERQANKINFCKNIALLGSAIILLSKSVEEGE